MNIYTKNYSVTWAQLHKDSKMLAWKLLNCGKKFKGIAAVTRGGLVPAAIIARELNIRLIDTICITSYDWQTQEEDITVLKGFYGEGDGEGWLIVDELVDTGRTAGKVRELLPKAVMASVYAKPAGMGLIDEFVTEVSQDTWILFPWDSEEQFVKPLSEQDL